MLYGSYLASSQCTIIKFLREVLQLNITKDYLVIFKVDFEKVFYFVD